MGVVQDVTAHVQKLYNAGNTTPQTPQAYATACGYRGSKASALRAHIARKHGQGARATGNGQYPPVTPAAMLQLLGAGHLVSKADATAQQRKQAAATVQRTLWPKQRAARKATGRKAKQQAKQATAEPTAQPQGSGDATAPGTKPLAGRMRAAQALANATGRITAVAPNGQVATANVPDATVQEVIAHVAPGTAVMPPEATAPTS